MCQDRSRCFFQCVGIIVLDEFCPGFGGEGAAPGLGLLQGVNFFFTNKGSKIIYQNI